MSASVLRCLRCKRGSVDKRGHCSHCTARFENHHGILVFERNESVEEMQRKKPNWYVRPQKDARRIYSHQYRLRRALLEQAVAHALKHTRGRATLIDVGCGDGHNLRELKRFRDTLTMIGFDYNLLRLDRAQHEAPYAQFVLADVTKPVIAPASVDIILINHVIEHVKDDVKLLRTLLSYLKPGGFLLLGTPQEGRFVYRVLRNRILEPYIPFITDHVQFYTDDVLLARIRKAGFTVDSVDYLNYAFPHSIIDKHLRKPKAVHDFFERIGHKHAERGWAGALWVVARKPLAPRTKAAAAAPRKR